MGIDPSHPINTVDVEYDLFWREVIDAVKHVELNHGLSYDIERGTRRAEIKYARYWNESKSIEDKPDCEQVEISIFEIEPKQPALIVPGAGEDK